MDFIHNPKIQNDQVQHSKQHHKRELPMAFIRVAIQTDRQTDRQTEYSLYFSTIKIKALQLVGLCKIIKKLIKTKIRLYTKYIHSENPCTLDPILKSPIKLYNLISVHLALAIVTEVSLKVTSLKISIEWIFFARSL